jgi:hypothetical protein
MTDNELVDAYRQALCSYEAAKAGCGSRIAAFIDLLSSETAMTSRLGIDGCVQRYRDRHQP